MRDGKLMAALSGQTPAELFFMREVSFVPEAEGRVNDGRRRVTSLRFTRS